MRGSVGIVGGGIGGLTAAIALRRRGFGVKVFERAGHRHQGVALLLWANATRLLADLGLDLRNYASTIEHTEIRTSFGDLLCSLPIHEWSQRASAYSVAIRRPVLMDCLTGMLPSDVVEHGATVSGFVTAACPRVRFANGDEREFDAVVGADGLHSMIRQQVHGDTPLRLLDQRAWVGVANPPPGLLRPGVTIAMIGHGPRFWSAPLPDGAAFWFATLNRTAAAPASSLDLLRTELQSWPSPIPQLLASSREDKVVEARICDRPPTNRWGEGPVTLLGDAAHASTPDLGQGACQAIESAHALAECLAKASSIELGLRAYEAERMQRTATISRLAWITSVNTTMENPLLCSLRDAGIKLALPAVARRHMAWILGAAA